MGITGKYDFAGIKAWGATGLYALLAATSVGAWLIKYMMGPVIKFVLENAVNWLANEGLVVLNVGAIYVEGEFSQSAFDNAMNDAIKKVETARSKLTPAQIKAIDDEVIAAARKFIPYSGAPN